MAEEGHPVPPRPRQTSPSAAGGAAASFQNTGSDTLVNLALAWAERYMALHPEVRISVTGGGSGTGIASLINGTVQIANASREMSAEEIAQAKKNGINPVRFTVALDAIAVVVNPDNPVHGPHPAADLRHVHGQDHALVGRGRGGSAHRPAFPRVQLRHLRVLPRAGHPAGRCEEQDPLFPGDAPHALLGGHRRRGAAEPQRRSATTGWAT